MRCETTTILKVAVFNNRLRAHIAGSEADAIFLQRNIQASVRRQTGPAKTVCERGYVLVCCASKLKGLRSNFEDFRKQTGAETIALKYAVNSKTHGKFGLMIQTPILRPTIANTA